MLIFYYSNVEKICFQGTSLLCRCIIIVLMARRIKINQTGISRLEGVPYHDAWISYSCVKCKSRNYLRIGQDLLTPEKALEICVWKCESCGKIHSKESDLQFENWEEEHKDAESLPALRFWEGFFRIATENISSYWKQCNVCGRVLPFNAFSKHSGWGPLGTR